MLDSPENYELLLLPLNSLELAQLVRREETIRKIDSSQSSNAIGTILKYITLSNGRTF